MQLNLSFIGIPVSNQKIGLIGWKMELWWTKTWKLIGIHQFPPILQATLQQPQIIHQFSIRKRLGPWPRRPSSRCTTEPLEAKLISGTSTGRLRGPSCFRLWRKIHTDSISYRRIRTIHSPHEATLGNTLSSTLRARLDPSKPFGKDL